MPIHADFKEANELVWVIQVHASRSYALALLFKVMIYVL